MLSNSNFKKKILQGGISLTLRQILVLLLSLANVLVVARILGPEVYGIVATSLGIFYFLLWTSKLGLGVYLVRQPDMDPKISEQVLSFYNTVGLFFCVLLVGIAPVFGWWTGKLEVTSIMRCLLLAVWLDMFAEVSLSMLKRNLCFAEVGLIDALSQLFSYVLAVVLVLAGWSYWGPVLATVAGIALKAIMAYRYHPVSWRWFWCWNQMRPVLGYGLTYSTSNFIRNAKNLVVPLLVSRLVGVSAVGIISISIRFAQQISILRLVIRDMSISVMAKLTQSPESVRDAISRGMLYQTLVVSPFCAAFSCLSFWLVPVLFGDEWLISTKIFPFVAFSLIVISIFDIHKSVLYATGSNNEVIKVYLLYTSVLWGVSLVALNKLGLWGYVIGEIAALPTFFLVHRSIVKVFGSPDYKPTFWLVIATSVPLFGGIFFHPYLSAILFFLSYGTLLVLNSKIRGIPKDLFLIINSK
jgi:PST family polysaccharide transporter